jgi:hypothetical protein
MSDANDAVDMVTKCNGVHTGLLPLLWTPGSIKSTARPCDGCFHFPHEVAPGEASLSVPTAERSSAQCALYLDDELSTLKSKRAQLLHGLACVLHDNVAADSMHISTGNSTSN